MKLPEGWHPSEDSYSVRYRHDQSSMTFLLKAVKMGPRLHVAASQVEGKTVVSLDIALEDHTHPAAPLDNLALLFVRLDTLIARFESGILSPLLPDLIKGTGSSSSSSSNTQPSNPSSSSSSSSNPDRIPEPPRAPSGPSHDPLRIGQPMRPGLPSFDRDRDPSFGFMPGGIPGFGGRAPGGFGGPGGGGGSLMGPRDPFFMGGGRGMPGPSRGPPSGLVPPGARWDPITPTGPFGPNGPNGGNGRGRGGLPSAPPPPGMPGGPAPPPPQAGSTDPDNDMEEAPPDENPYGMFG